MLAEDTQIAEQSKIFLRHETDDDVRNEWKILADTTKEYVSEMLNFDSNGLALKTDFYRNYV